MCLYEQLSQNIYLLKTEFQDSFIIAIMQIEQFYRILPLTHILYKKSAMAGLPYTKLRFKVFKTSLHILCIQNIKGMHSCLYSCISLINILSLPIVQIVTFREIRFNASAVTWKTILINTSFEKSKIPTIIVSEF